MVVPARVRTSTPARSLEQAKCPSCGLLLIPPYPSELRPSSARPHPQGNQIGQIARLVPPHTRRSPLNHDSALKPCSLALVSRGPPSPSAPLSPASRVRGREAGPGARPPGWGRGRRGQRPRVGVRRGPARCRCRRPEWLQLRRRGRQQRDPGGGLRGGPACSRDHGGPERPLQDRGGRGRGVRQDGAAAGVRQGRLPGGEGPASWEGGAEAAGLADWRLGKGQKRVLG